MLNEMNQMPYQAARDVKFNVTVQDVAHWAGLSLEVTRDEINKLAEKRKLEIFENYIVVNNIADLKRIVDTRYGTVVTK
jgi:hypothetical protein